MTDTYCKYCSFANIEDKKCFFDIPSLLPAENIHDKEGSILIKNYKCSYGINKEEIIQYNLSIDQLKNHAIQRNLLRYYLVLDVTECSSLDIDHIIQVINNLDIKPKFISFILNLKDNNYQLAFKIQSNMDQSIKWKLHNWLKHDSLDHCRYTILATNLGNNNSNCLLFSKIKSNEDLNKTNDRINYSHLSQIVKQEPAHIICENLYDIDGLFLPNMLYREIMDETNFDRNLLGAIRTIKEREAGFKILQYNYA